MESPHILITMLLDGSTHQVSVYRSLMDFGELNDNMIKVLMFLLKIS